MSANRDQFWQLMSRHPSPGEEVTRMALEAAAAKWREAGRHFSAGYAMERAELAAWGDGEMVYSCLRSAVQDYHRCIETQEACSYEALAAILKLSEVLTKLRTYFPELQDSGIAQTRDTILGELGQRLITCYAASAHAEGFLVRGVWLNGNLEGDWHPEFPQWEVTWGEQTWSWGSRTIRISLPSAFELLVSLGDYQGAYVVVQEHSQAFTTPRLRGWKAAVQGFVRPAEAPELFAEAAAAFAEDVHPTEADLKLRGSWSSINIELWANYFRSRSALAMALREPVRAKELISASAAAIRGDIHWMHPEVLRYQLLVQTLAHLMGAEPGLSPEQAQERFLRETRPIGREAYDDVLVQFLTLAGEAFDGFKADPVKELAAGRLARALEALARIPIIGPDVSQVVERPISIKATERLIEHAPEDVFGPIRTWIYRTLEGIKDEKQLRRIILRLLQASSPLHAQIRHGPIEYGKDVVVLLEQDGRHVLRMYQAKCGDITKSRWRESQPELEEIFLVPLTTLALPAAVDDCEGILVCNGHVTPFVEPVMEGWFQDQARVHGRIYKFMSLDGLVRWIVAGRLMNDFRAALAELDLEPIVRDDTQRMP